MIRKSSRSLDKHFLIRKEFWVDLLHWFSVKRTCTCLSILTKKFIRPKFLKGIFWSEKQQYYKCHCIGIWFRRSDIKMKKSNSLPTDSLEYLRADVQAYHMCYSLPPSPGNSLSHGSNNGLLSRLKRKFSKRILKKHYNRRASDESSIDFDFERERSSSAGSLTTVDIEVPMLSIWWILMQCFQLAVTGLKIWKY